MPVLRITPQRQFRHAGNIPGWSWHDPRTNNFWPSEVQINLSRCEFIWPPAVIWCACYALLVRNIGRDCEVIVPEDPGVAAYLKSAGLFSILQEAGVNIDDRVIGQTATSQTVLPMSRIVRVRDADYLVDEAFERLNDMGFPGPQMAPTVSETFGEFASNAAQHAESPIGGIGMIQYYRFKEGQRFAIAVGDGGIGIRSALNNNPDLRDKMKDDRSAIGLAVQEMVSGTRDPHRGLGLFTATEDARRGGRQLIIHSGTGALSINEDAKGEPRKTNPFPGTLTYVAYNVM